MALSAAVVDGRGARRARRGHPWILRSSIVSLDARPGDVVRVEDRSGRFACWAACSPESRIVLRRVSRDESPPDELFWSQRVAAALARRGELSESGSARLVNSDADGLPGLTLDSYAGHLVVQATSVWADLNAGAIAREVARLVPVSSVLARNDAPVRSREGLERTVAQISGVTPPEIVAECAGLERLVDAWSGHKTGLYLDQQENQRRAPDWLAGRVLDLFCGEGGFSMPLARAGCRVLAVDQSKPGLDRGARAAARLGLAGGVEWERANAFDVLVRLESEGAAFDGAVLDPPPFTRGRGRAGEAVSGYRDLHRRALRLLRPGARLLTFCCSYAVDAAAFESAVRAGAEEAGVSLRVLDRPGQAPDHTELLELPESRYLKGLLVELEPSAPRG